MESETMTLMMFVTQYWVELSVVGFGLTLVAASILAFAWGEERGRSQVDRLTKRQFMARKHR